MMLKAIPFILLLLSGCGSRVAPEDPGRAAPHTASAAAAQPVKIDEKTELLDFHLAWPSEVSAIPQLAAKIRAAAVTHKEELLKSAAADKAYRANNDFPFHPYEYSDEFTVEADTSRLLSLGESWFEYTGGAHPMHGTRARLWDRSAGREIAFTDLFTGGAAALDRLFKTAYCAALDKDRAQKRGPAETASRPDDPFNECPKFADLALIPSGTPEQRMNEITFHADPYLAGPYAEGDYDVVLPVTEQVIAALKPAYRSSFKAQRPQ
jgi:hypothetical protein